MIRQLIRGCISSSKSSVIVIKFSITQIKLNWANEDNLANLNIYLTICNTIFIQKVH